MAAKRLFVAVDTNVLLDLANKEEPVLDAIATIRRRIRPVTIGATPTVLHELANLIDHGETAEKRLASLTAGQKFNRLWKFEPIEPQCSTGLRNGLPSQCASEDCFLKLKFMIL